MKTVVISCSDFSPSSLPPSLRIRFLANHLPDYGWRPILVSTDPRCYDVQMDWENDRLLAPGLEVVHTSAIPRGLSRLCGVGDIGMRSFFHHWRKISEICNRQNVDLIFVSIPPYVPALLGRLLNFTHQIPYVLDYIDPWISEYYWTLPRSARPPKWRMSYYLSRVLEPLALRRVSAIVAVSKGTTDGVISRYPSLTEVRTAEIPYGAESDDLAYLDRHPRRHGLFTSGDGLHHMSYVGAVGASTIPATRGFFRALSLVSQRSPALVARLRVHFVGSSYSPTPEAVKSVVMSLAHEYGVADVVKEHIGRVPYLDSLQILKDSNSLLLLGTEEPHYTASKVFPYLLAGKPVLSIIHEASTLVHMLNDAGVGRIASFSSEQSASDRSAIIASHLESILETESHDFSVGDPAKIDRYSTRQMSARLAEVFDAVLTAESSR